MAVGFPEETVQRWAMPAAQLFYRACHGKSPMERHVNAFYLWEAGLKLLASAAVVSYAAQDERDSDLVECLKNLA